MGFRQRSPLNGNLRLSECQVDPTIPLRALRLIRKLFGARDLYADTRLFRARVYRRVRTEQEKILGALNRILHTYASLPEVTGIDSYGVWWRGRDQELSRSCEEAMISKMIDLAESNQLDRLRTCSFCKCWFFAKQPNQACCKKTCGQKLRAGDAVRVGKRNERRNLNYVAERVRDVVQANAKPWPKEWTKARPKHV